MQDNILEPKPISDLLGEKFFIPAYQRGYRWNKQQVFALLDDIKEFQQTSEESGDKKQFYCLQPIVVKKRDDQWEVVDGQQRLTTIYIILTFLKSLLDDYDYSRYKIEYETRPDSTEFLDNIDVTKAEENIDFFHIVKAKEAVGEWFKTQDRMYRNVLFQTLLSSDEIGKNVKMIWYELGEHENAVEVFTRLNMGKIPLVNAELIKALFLKSSQFSQQSLDAHQLQQIKISQEWDDIEKKLQDDAFWYFLSNADIQTNRIELILKLRATDSQFKNIDVTQGDKLKIFLQYNAQLSKNVDLAQEWLTVKQYFMSLEEWYNDRELFHLIGFLISQGEKITDIINISRESKGKKDFNRRLINIIFKRAFEDERKVLIKQNKLAVKINDYISELNYGYTRVNKLRQILLLFNIISLLSNPKSNARFQFEKFKLEKWDIEHIYSVNSEIPNSSTEQIKWLQQIIKYLSDDNNTTDGLIAANQKSLANEINEALSIKQQAFKLLEISFTKEQFKTLYERVMTLYNPKGDDEVDNSIGNLTLLDQGTNRSYKNAIFPIKRNTIIGLDKKATYVPLCTKNVFLKYYSSNVDKMLYWQKEDALNYKQAMIDILTEFFSQEEA
ncbi:DUF262 domain-containing protein [Psychrobacter sp. I-STPA10]|uniref:DUF262 domain-containing protein n=1 Tax=Psychrobacter sp. I-STPA10 TaxID=2585769 RepID=UPI001E2FA56A|nr:DUF262 domain-containing protein [Psychrobacter sp. I-STPA10]